MSKKDEQLIKKGEYAEEDDGYTVDVVDNPVYDVDPEEKAATVAYYKPEEEDEEEMVEVKLPYIDPNNIDVHVPGNNIVM